MRMSVSKFNFGEYFALVFAVIILMPRDSSSLRAYLGLFQTFLIEPFCKHS